MAIRKAKLLWRGRDRQTLRKLYDAVKSMQGRDARMSAAVLDPDTTKFFFGGDDLPGAATAMTTLINRCNALFAMKA